MNWIWFGGLVTATVISLGIIILMERKDTEEDEQHECDAVAKKYLKGKK